MKRFENWVSGISGNENFKLNVKLIKNDEFGDLSKFMSEFKHEKDQSWQQKQRIVIFCWNSPELASLDNTHLNKDDPCFAPFQRLPPTNSTESTVGEVIDVDPNVVSDLEESQLFGFVWSKVRPKISIFLHRGPDLGRLLFSVKNVYETKFPNDWVEQMSYLVDLNKSPFIQNVSCYLLLL